MASSSLDHIFLPFDLTEEILSAIPIEYLIRFHLICKQWHSLLKNKRFIYNYLNLTQERFIRIDSRVEIIDPLTQTRLISPLPSKFPYRPLISTMIHCDGLVLLKLNNLELGRRRLLIWNPILGQIKWIQPKPNFFWYTKTEDSSFAEVSNCHGGVVMVGYNDDKYGIGYNKASPDDHKILRFYNRIYLEKSERYNDIEIEIYDLKSDSWKYLEDTCHWSLVSSWKGVSVSGNMYWVAERWQDGALFIQSFDFSTETFVERDYLPSRFAGDYVEKYMVKEDIIALSSFGRDKLCLLHQCAKTKKIEVWVTKVDHEDIEEDVSWSLSWSKYLSVDITDLPWLYSEQNLANPGFFIDKNGKIRVWCEERNEERENDEEEDVFVSVYEISKDGFKKEFERARSNSYGDYDRPFLSGYVFVPSFVPLLQ